MRICTLCCLTLLLVLLAGCERGPGRATGLHKSARAGDVKQAQRLIDKGARVNAVNAEGRTPLHEAVNCKHVEMIRLLVSHGADVNAKDNRGRTPLHCAIVGGPGADFHCVPSDKDMVRILVEHGANVNMAGRYGTTPLHLAAFRGDVNMIRMLLERGVELNVKDQYGDTPLGCALLFQQGEAAIALITASAELVETSSGLSPLHHAAEMGNKQLAGLLIAKGVDVNAKTAGGETPLDRAVSRNHQDIVDLLKAAGGQTGR